ncbi:MAG: endonuclease III [Nanoarchaeota archaeon]|nr:endonuclease III [Nanoarchaeota archaeon]MBU4299700.1 endonuclease III [Nanoarchaeota archaeon]MBU4451200.1 endonuclease III [Nanoarchaeota archaeon]MCG2723298.1 endonuclease III [archaeon]
MYEVVVITEAPSQNASELLAILKKTYGAQSTALIHQNPFELLVSTILSAQCTDARINSVTRELFKKYQTANDYANADLHEFEQDIKSTGFYKNKAKNIIAAAQKIISEFGGKVPGKMEELVTLPGVGRKTANVILCEGFGIVQGIAIDTHVRRISFRIGLTKNTDPKKIECDLMALYSKKEWRNVSNLLIAHGRRTCYAKKPKCGECALNKICPNAFKV